MGAKGVTEADIRHFWPELAGSGRNLVHTKTLVRAGVPRGLGPFAITRRLAKMCHPTDVLTPVEELRFLVWSSPTQLWRAPYYRTYGDVGSNPAVGSNIGPGS
jgi:hypothetical protein